MTPGTRLGSYEVVSALGAGGMGEVYRARDTKLDRDVALKILPESFASDPDRLMRFEREAKTLASLNHPNIAAIYGIEDRAIVMELVEGRDLSEVIAGGAEAHALHTPQSDRRARASAPPISLDEAIAIARQIAEALEAAHEAGIIHRDLKPANIKVRDDGTVKVLDFGLAKALDSGPSDPGTPGPLDPTMTSPALTAIGLILGTAAYMSPEQARGRPVDRRADIWAFGVVLYEMVTGRRLFDGPTVSDTLAAVLRADIDLATLPASTPSAIRRLLARCLDREPKNRLQHIGEARIALQGPAAELAQSVADGAAGTSTGWPRWQTALVAVIGALVVAAGTWMAKPVPETSSSVTRFDVMAAGRWISGIAISPDGSRVAWIGTENSFSQPRMFVRRMDEVEARRLEVGDGQIGFSLAISPEGDRLAYGYRQPGSASAVWEIRVMPIDGGRSELVTTTGDQMVPFMTWGPDEIYFSLVREIRAIRSYGGSQRTVLAFTEPGESGSRLTAVNGGRDLLFVRRRAERYSLWTVPAAGGEPRLVLDGVFRYAVTPTGHLVYSTDSDRILFGRQFREDRVEIVGDAVALGEIEAAETSFVVSDTGTLMSLPRRTVTESVWVDRSSGRAEPLPGVPSSAGWVDGLSPSGRYLLMNDFARRGAPGREVWILDLQEGGRTRVSVESGSSGRWIPGTDAVILTSSTTSAVMRVRAPWSTAPVAIGTASGFVYGVSSDERQLLTTSAQGVVLVNTDGSGTPVPVDPQASSQESAGFSPDGRWVYYASSEDEGRDLWLRPYPATAQGRWRLGSLGEGGVFWKPDGREVIFASGGGWVSRTVRAGAPGAPPDLGPTVPVDVPSDITLTGVTPDGRRLLGIRLVDSQETISFVLNFFEELRAKVPVQ